jgi:hypothetical protein
VRIFGGRLGTAANMPLGYLRRNRRASAAHCAQVTMRSRASCDEAQSPHRLQIRLPCLSPCFVVVGILCFW